VIEGRGRPDFCGVIEGRGGTDTAEIQDTEGAR
jgi:hypothetical protein